MSHKKENITSYLGSRSKALLFDDGGIAARTRYFHALPAHHEQKAERFVAVAQFVLVLLMITMERIGRALGDDGGLDLVVVAWCGLFTVGSALRWIATTRDELPDNTLDMLTVLDVAGFLSIAMILQIAEFSATGNIAASQFAFWLVAMIAIRVVRVHPRSILVAGSAVLAGLIAAPEITLARYELGGVAEALRFDVGALLAFSLFIIAMTYATWQARLTLGHLNATLENMPHGVALFDKEHRLVVSNSQYSLLYGLNDEHRKRGTSISDLISYRHEAGCFGNVDYQTHATGWMDDFSASEPSIQQLNDGRVFSILRQKEPEGRIVTTTEDVTSQRRLEAHVEYLAYHDSLTGLANRTQLREKLEKILLGNRTSDIVTAFCLDLDRFKEINDTLGHHIGDDLLKAVGQRLKECVREGDLVARTGGDEFIILQMGDCTCAHSADLAQRIIKSLTKPFELRKYQVLIGVSIGIAVPDGQDIDANRLIKNADIALYRAKESGRGIFCFYEESMSQRLQERREIENDLRKALDGREFELHYQPIVSAGSGNIESMEALIRWQHPEKGMISPGDFIPIIDEIGLAAPLGNWVIRQACKDAASLSDNTKVSVNVSAAQFHKPGLADSVARALRSTRLPADRLELEITETVLLENSEATIATLNKLHKLGVRIALDDFGTGYSSLSYLKTFSFDRLKIDRSFVKDALTDHSSSEIIKSVIELGQRLGMEITAEGVETDEQLVRVTADGCTAIQGFLISRPLPLLELNKFLKARTSKSVVSVQKPVLSQVG